MSSELQNIEHTKSPDELDRVTIASTIISGLLLGAAYAAEALHESSAKYALVAVSGLALTLSSWRVIKEPNNSYITHTDRQ